MELEVGEGGKEEGGGKGRRRGCTMTHTRHLGACRAPMDLQRATQGGCVPAECLSRNVIMYRLKYVHEGDFT